MTANAPDWPRDVRDLDTEPDITPANLGDPHPLARIACTLGAAADLAVAARQVEQGRLLDEAQLAGTYIRVLSLAYSAARHAVAHGAVVDADRPLAVAQYAERSIDVLREGAERPLALVRLTATSPEPAPAKLNERLEAAVDLWTQAAEPELLRLVPSADTLRMLANQGAHLCAAQRYMHAVEGRDAQIPKALSNIALDGDATKLPKSF